MDANELWSKACQMMKAEMTDIAYKTWIESSLTPMSLEENTLCLTVVADFMKQMIETKYKMLIINAVSLAAGHPVMIELLTEKEAEERSAGPDEPAVMQSFGLDPHYTFESFVVGSNSRFAHAAALAVAEAPGKAYNPLFIYGGVGLGKTHLMQAVGHYAYRQNPSLRICYTTSEAFTNELISALQTNRNQEFRDRFRNVDLLMVDDIQFIAGRNSTQEEFFHTFNVLHAAGKQIIMTSDKPPREIAHLEERLCSRFEGGLIADIQRPDLDTRVAILRNKAERDNLVFPSEVLTFVAEKVDSNIRELEGSLTRIQAYASLCNRPVDLTLAEEALREAVSRREAQSLTPEQVQDAVAQYYGTTLEALTGTGRSRTVMVPRQVAMYLIRELVGLSLPRIGECFGGKDHTTVMHSCDKVAAALSQDEELAVAVDDIRRRLKDVH